MTEASQPTEPLPDIERYRNYLRVLADIQLGKRLQSKVDASDIVQVSMYEAHQGLSKGTFGSEAELLAYLRKVLVNNLLNVVRQYETGKRDISRERSLAADVEHSSARLEQFLAAEQTTPSQQAVRNENAGKLAAALAKIPESQRQAIVLKHFHNKSLAEIAVELDRTELAVAGLLKRGLQKLRELMAEEAS
jgi:RNA polymerase sigma-70 factor, ECF subfamily